jgi:hypothetical protein
MIAMIPPESSPLSNFRGALKAKFKYINFVDGLRGHYHGLRARFRNNRGNNKTL